MQSRRAFTLIELLVVIAIIAILASILFPVFAQAKDAAKKTLWMSHMKQLGPAKMMYANDWDDRLALSNAGGNNLPGWGFGAPDKVWPQLIKPYVKNWIIYRCPKDRNATDQGLSMNPYDQPVSQNHPDIEYFWGERSNAGLNYQFLSPWVYYYDKPGRYVGSESVNMSQIGQTAGTIMTTDSIWYRHPQTGEPMGGGNWVIEPPCVVDSAGQVLIPVSDLKYYGGYGGCPGGNGGWRLNSKGTSNYWLEFGGAWPFFNKKFTTTFTDGHAGSLSLGRLTDGCDVKSCWQGAAYDGDKYLYDLR